MTDRDKRLPSLDRILYDEAFGTDTRFGLGPDQIFVDPDLARSTIIAILNDPNREFDGVDIDNFINNTLNFSTPEDIVNTMNAIYDTFSPEDVNFIFFQVLQDAFSTKQEFEEFFKTSWVALEINQNFQNPEPVTPRNLNLQPGGACFIEAPTPSPTTSPTPTPQVSVTPSLTVTPNATLTPTPTVTPTVTSTPNLTPTVTPTGSGPGV
jgi:hypothetical protein